MSETKTYKISLCDGWRVGFTNPLQVYTFKNGEYQKLREFLGLGVDSDEWDIITRELFCFGHIEFTIQEDSVKRRCTIEVIPCGRLES